MVQYGQLVGRMVNNVANGVIGIRGDLLRWARIQQELPMRRVTQLGGPSPAYQSEVETGKKTVVTSSVLLSWIRPLKVTVEFACGLVPKYMTNPEACHGLTGDIGEAVRTGQFGQTEWEAMTASERARRVLQLVADRSALLPRVVLAYVMNVSVRTLDEMMLGTHPIMKGHMETMATITTLSLDFFKHGAERSHAGIEPRETEELLHFYPALRVAQEAGMTPAELAELITHHIQKCASPDR